MKDKPIWGVQFHPDFLFDDIPAILERAETKDPLLKGNLVKTFINAEMYDENLKIFANFIKQ